MKENKRLLAKFEFATVEKKDQNGNLQYDTVTSVNQDLKISPDGYDQIRVGQHNVIEVTEREVFDSNGDNLYSKKVNVKQMQKDGSSKGQDSFRGSGYNGSQPQTEKPYDPEAGLTHKTATLKNMIDNCMSNERFLWIALVVIGAATVIGFALMNLK